MTEEKEFLRQLNGLSKDADEAAAYIYSWRALNIVASKNKLVYHQLNRTALLWNTLQSALLTSGFVALGRIFDSNSKRNVSLLLRVAQTNLHFFSLDALATRKRKGSENADEWLADYLKTAYVPKPDDFRELRKFIAIQRKIYEKNYREIRDQVFAHNLCQDSEHVHALFAKTNVAELEKLLMFLTRFHDALWNLYHNGRKPTLRSSPHSAKQMLRRHTHGWTGGVSQRVVTEAKELLKALTHPKKSSAVKISSLR